MTHSLTHGSFERPFRCLDEPSPLITIPVLRQVRIVNQTSEVDEARYSSISPLQPIDDMFRIEDNVIDIGLIIIIDVGLIIIRASLQCSDAMFRIVIDMSQSHVSL